MAMWMVRAGKHGEHEQRFLNESRIYLTWHELNGDLHTFQDKKDQLRDFLKTVFPSYSNPEIGADLGQIWPFIQLMKPGDRIVLPSKLNKSAIHLGELKGEYVYSSSAESPYWHSREVDWRATDIPRTAFDKDIAFALPPRTISEIRDDAAGRIWELTSADRQMSIAGSPQPLTNDEDSEQSQEATDVEAAARDEIARYIQRKFKGQDLARLVDAVLRAQGYTTLFSLGGPDNGIDILAAPGPLGFGQPRLCVQVKSGNAPLDRPTLDQLLGVMRNVNADFGLLVSWGGFNRVVRNLAIQQREFFRVRLWDQSDLIDELLDHYEQLDDGVRAELPLKRFWSIVQSEAMTVAGE